MPGCCGRYYAPITRADGPIPPEPVADIKLPSGKGLLGKLKGKKKEDKGEKGSLASGSVVSFTSTLVGEEKEGAGKK